MRKQDVERIAQEELVKFLNGDHGVDTDCSKAIAERVCQEDNWGEWFTTEVTKDGVVFLEKVNKQTQSLLKSIRKADKHIKANRKSK
jgi:hypothetical protein